MKKFNFLFLAIVVFNSCVTDKKVEIKKLAEGVYQKGEWIYDMKELPSGKSVIPFYTIGKLSTNVLKNTFTNPPSEMGITLYFVLDKQGENKNKIVSIYLESTASDENLFKFPRCLSLCPITVEVTKGDGSVEELEATYSRPNVFKMQMEDLVLADIAQNQGALRLRIPVSRSNQNTTFEWFNFDFSGYTSKL